MGESWRDNFGRDPFLRWGFRVAKPPVRLALNQIALDIRMAAKEQKLALLQHADPLRLPYLAIGLGLGQPHSDFTAGLAELDLPPGSALFADIGRGFGMGLSRRRIVSLSTFRRNAMWTGIGLSRAYRKWPQYIEDQQGDQNPHPAIDRGIGAMIWLGSGAEPLAAAAITHSFPVARQEQLWRGLGFAVAFSVDIDDAQAELLMRSCGPSSNNLIRGIAFGAQQRLLFGTANNATARLCAQTSGLAVEALVRKYAEDFADWA